MTCRRRIELTLTVLHRQERMRQLVAKLRILAGNVSESHRCMRIAYIYILQTTGICIYIYIYVLFLNPAVTKPNLGSLSFREAPQPPKSADC